MGRLFWVGIDLTGNPKRMSAAALVGRRQATVEWIGSDEEIVARLSGLRPRVVAIDAPLSFPSNGVHLRSCDKEVRRLGVSILPPTLGPMRHLTDRGIRLSGYLKSAGVAVIETYPRAVHRLMGWLGPGERPSARTLRSLHEHFPIRVKTDVNEHAIDALTCAWVAYLHWTGKTVELGDPREGTIALPRACITPSRRSPRTSRRSHSRYSRTTRS
ncbi:MAG: DUF429 domain-containing protein [Thaumarchaeota archaeon]|nr:DUF429 domain-containing protein [Candidatus Calditenuaceae archaeon]